MVGNDHTWHAPDGARQSLLTFRQLPSSWTCIAGANIVLGVQWLKSLRPVLTDYNTMCMKFFHGGQLVELKGDTEPTLNLLTQPQFRWLLRKQGTSCHYHIVVLSDEAHSALSTTPHPPRLQALISHFGALFQPPSSLPPVNSGKCVSVSVSTLLEARNRASG